MGIPGYTARVLRTISSSRASRHMRAAVRRKNAFDPVLERGARYDTSRIPVNEVNREWWHNALSGRKAHMRSGIYYEVFQQVLQCNPYTPIGNFTVTYPPSEHEHVNEPSHVLLGNPLLPKSTAVEPTVEINWASFDTQFASLILTNPDGYLLNNKFEILHWLVTNIPRGKPVLEGDVMKEYLQPLPFYGTGLHRFIFFLIEHDKPIAYNQIVPENFTKPISKFEDRIFLTSRFLSDNQITPSECVSFRLFQSMWDTSVSRCTIDKLKVSEPYYRIFVPLTKSQKKGKIIRAVRSNKYRIT